MFNTTATPAGVHSPAADFLAAIFKDAPDGQLLHFRVIRPAGPVVDQQYHPIGEFNADLLPTQYDGNANVYFGVATRTREEGTGAAAGSVGIVWCDEITKPAPDLPPFSIMVETSPGKVQAYYLLDCHTDDLERVSRLSQRLGKAVGGDNVHDIARMLRLPGFLNVKTEHPEHPRAFLLEFNPDLRYSLDDLDRLLPPLLVDDGHGEREYKLREHEGPFDPHSGTPLADADQQRLADFCRELNLRRQSDGRFAGTCPLRHSDGASISEQNFYCSPVTGRWHCFGSNHVGQNHGGVDALRLVGFDLSLPDDAWLRELVNNFGTGWLGGEELEPFKRKKASPENVAHTVSIKNPSITVNATSPQKRQNPQASRGSEAVALFPYRKGDKPLVKSTVLYSGASRQLAVVDLLSNSWRRSINAQFKRRKLFVNLLPKLEFAPVYMLKIAVDDYDAKRKKAIKKQLERAEAEHVWIDNGLRCGYFIYFANVPLKGWEMVWEPKAELVKALKAISPPTKDEDIDRFRPYGGSRGWIGGAMAPLEVDQDRWHVIAQLDAATDWKQWEAEFRASRIPYEETPEFWKRSQWGAGLIADFDSESEALDLAVHLGYAPVKNLGQVEVPA